MLEPLSHQPEQDSLPTVPTDPSPGSGPTVTVSDPLREDQVTTLGDLPEQVTRGMYKAAQLNAPWEEELQAARDIARASVIEQARMRKAVLELTPSLPRLNDLQRTLDTYLLACGEVARMERAVAAAMVQQAREARRIDAAAVEAARDAGSIYKAVSALHEEQRLMTEMLRGTYFAEINRTIESTRSVILRSLRLDAFDDVSKCEDGDPEAARRLADRTQWRPGGLTAQALSARARAEGKSVDELASEALVRAILLVCSDLDSPKTMLIPAENRLLTDADFRPVTTDPIDWPVAQFYEWVKHESVRAAQYLLFGLPYVPQVVIDEVPEQDGPVRLTAFAIIEANVLASGRVRGRPTGSGVFPDRQTFVASVRMAAVRIQGQGQTLTQENVSRRLMMEGLLGLADHVRQLQYWRERFGFSSWAELRDCL